MTDRHAWLLGFRPTDRAAAWFDFLVYGEAVRDENGRRQDVRAYRERRRRRDYGDTSPLPAIIRGPKR